MNALQEARAVEVRQDEESSLLAAVSVSTLRYMLDHGLALSLRLSHHRANLLYLAEDERDLLEAMSLATRLNRVSANMARTDRRNERVRAELVARKLTR